MSLPKEIRIIDNRRWRVTSADYYSRGDFPGIADTSTGRYWIVCLDNPADIRILSIKGWADYPTEDKKR